MKKHKAPLIQVANLKRVENAIYDSGKYSRNNMDGPSIPIHLKVYNHGAIYKLIAYVNGRLIYVKTEEARRK